MARLLIEVQRRAGRPADVRDPLMAWVFIRYAPKGSPLYTLQIEAQSECRGLWADPLPVGQREFRRLEQAR